MIDMPAGQPGLDPGPATRGAVAKPMTYHCVQCGRAIFRAADIIDRVTLWDLSDYQAECFVIASAIDGDELERYDASLHEGWYCCRFIMMRMLVDKFGTGDSLLVYSDSVVAVPDGAPVVTAHDSKGQIKLSSRDYDLFLGAPQLKDKLIWVKYGAIWCPPCRLLDAVFARIADARLLPDVVFAEVDIDEEAALAERWDNSGIPFSVFYYGGRQIHLSGRGMSVVQGGLVGGLTAAQVTRLAATVLQHARLGESSVAIGAA
jgi:thiol-disulfide isomerase/thioredoxin